MPPEPARQLMTHDEWMKRTHSLLHRRSALLKELDHKILWYERLPIPSRLRDVQSAFDAWKQEKGPGDAWRNSTRNGSGAFTLLDRQLRGVGDTDAAAGVPAFMAPALVHARLGILYLFAKTSIDENILSHSVGGAIEATTAGLLMAPAANQGAKLARQGLSVAQQPAQLAAAQIPLFKGAQAPDLPLPATPHVSFFSQAGLKQAYETIAAKVNDALAKLWAMIREKASAFRQDPGGAALELLPGILRKIAGQLISKLWLQVAPLVGAALDLAKGVCNLIDSGIVRFREWMASKSVRVLEGHPGVIVDAIRRAMSVSVGEGLFDMLKGGLNLGMQIASAGAAVIVGAVASMLEALAKAVWRVFEIIRMKMFVGQAQTHWQARDQPDALHTRPIDFNAWFRRYALHVPALAIVALNSGICDKMHFLAMFSDDGAVIEQQSFDAGVAYVDSLKDWGAAYLRDGKYQFSSTDPFVQGLLKLGTSHQQAQSKGDHAWQFVRRFLNG